MKAFSIITVISFFLLTSVQTASAEFSAAYVDIQRALGESVAGKTARVEYEKEVKKAQGDIDKKKTAFQQKRQALEKQQGSLNKDALSEKQEELLGLERDLQRDFKDFEAKLRRKNGKMVGELLGKLRAVVQEVASSKGYTIVLEKNSDAVLYADSNIDITADVISAFNKSAK